MIYKKWSKVLGTLTVLLLALSFALVPATSVFAVGIAVATPIQGPAGTTVTITGAAGEFAPNIAPASSRVWFDSNGNNAYDAGEPFCQPGTAADGSINLTNNTLAVPSVAAGAYSIRVDIPVGGNVEGAANFQVTTATIATTAPLTGRAGTLVTIAGAGFEPNILTANTRVWFDTNNNGAFDVGEPSCAPETSAIGVVQIGAGSITFNVPAVAAGTYQIRADIPTGGAVEASVAFVVLPATLVLAPAIGAGGTVVTVTGANYSTSVAVGNSLVFFDTNNNGAWDIGEPSCQPGTTAGGALPNAGGVGDSFTVPAGLAAGAYTVRADVPVGLPLDATAIFTVPATGITLAPTTGGPGTAVAVTGAGFPALIPTRIWLDLNGNGAYDVATEAGVTATPNTDAAGAIAATNINLPAVIAAGTYNFLCDCPVGGAVEATAPFVVPTASITATPATGGPGTAVLIAGGGFAINTPGNLWLDLNGNGTYDAATEAVVYQNPTTTPAGALAVVPATQIINIPAGLAAGTYNFLFDCPAGVPVEASTPFVVTGTAITLTPATGAAGTAITVTGAGFAAGGLGNIWFDTDGDSVLDPTETSIPVTASVTGTIPAGTSIPAPTVTDGTYQVRCDLPTGGVVEASAPFAVTAAPSACIPPCLFSVDGTATIAAGAYLTIIPRGDDFMGMVSIRSNGADYDITVCGSTANLFTVVENGALNACYPISGYGMRITNDTATAITITYVATYLK